MGVLGYVSSPLWLILLTLSTADILTQTIVGHNYFLPGYNLFPNWPVSKTAETISLFGVTIGILLVPKLYSLILTMSTAACAGASAERASCCSAPFWSCCSPCCWLRP